MASLVQTPTDRLKAATPAGGEYILDLADALKALWTGDEDVAGRLLEALRKTDPHRLDPRIVEYVLDIQVPILDAFRHAIEGDPAAFDAAR